MLFSFEECPGILKRKYSGKTAQKPFSGCKKDYKYSFYAEKQCCVHYSAAVRQAQ